MEILYRKYCPSCSAPIELREGERLLECSYCGVRNYMVIHGPLRFVLPDKIPDDVDREKRFFVPYVRFKGSVFVVKGAEVHHSIMDTTHIGVSSRHIATSLGLRPQAMKLHLLEREERGGRFLKRTEKLVSVFNKAARLSDYFDEDSSKKLWHRAFIGETISLIYLPVYLKGGQLVDGVLNRRLIDDGQAFIDQHELCEYQKNWAPDFLAMICPYCGYVMETDKVSLVIHCHNCFHAWCEENGRLTSVNWQIVRANDRYLQIPFWKITLEIEGLGIKTFGDFLRETNQPIHVKKEYDNKLFSLLIPAVKLPPRMFLTLTKRFTLSQPKIQNGTQEKCTHLQPVTLPLKEAVESYKTLLVSIAVHKKKISPLLGEIKARYTSNTLLYLPFDRRGNDLAEIDTGITLPAGSLQLGNKL